MMTILLIFMGLLFLFILTIIIGRAINRQKYKIRSSTGIQKTDFITIGDIEQYIQIRGQDVKSPIIIVLHGGPGNNMAYYSYCWQAELEKEYTIVHWDQRGCGNTYYRNKSAEKPTIDLLLSDLDELVDYICAEYGKENVVMMGHSWGTLLGGIYASRHPKKVSAYVGIGQFCDIWQSEQCAAEEAVRLATAAGKTGDARKIETQIQLVCSNPKLNMREILRLRQLTGKYLPEGEHIPFSVGLFSPYMTLHDFKWFLMPLFGFRKFIESQSKLYDTIYSESKISAYRFTQYEVPVVIIAGDSDWITPYRMARDYFDSITAPKKEFILFENAGHIPFKSEKFTEIVVNALSIMSL